MKIRIRGNSVRMRVTQIELQQFADHGRITDTISFGGDSRLRYQLVTESGGDSLAADYSSDTVTIRIPTGMAEEWIESELVSLEGEQQAGGQESLRILVEKDFACLVPREGEDDSDAFPHPEAEEESC